MGIFDSFRKKRAEDRSVEKKQEIPSRSEPVALGKWQVGDRIQNRYEIHAIKLGGMGIVYICYDYEFKEPVVIKTFQDKFASEAKQSR